MQSKTDIFTALKGFLSFDDADVSNLQRLAPLFEAKGGEITDRFYEKLAATPDTAKIIEGRVESLKRTHARWMSELFTGDYGDGYFDNRWRIGMTHVRVGVPPHYVEAVVSFLRTKSELVVQAAMGDAGPAHHISLVKLLDLDLMIINLAYSAERIERLSTFTGMSKKLIERCIEKGT